MQRVAKRQYQIEKVDITEDLVARKSAEENNHLIFFIPGLFSTSSSKIVALGFYYLIRIFRSKYFPLIVL